MIGTQTSVLVPINSVDWRANLPHPESNNRATYTREYVLSELGQSHPYTHECRIEVRVFPRFEKNLKAGKKKMGRFIIRIMRVDPHQSRVV